MSGSAPTPPAAQSSPPRHRPDREKRWLRTTQLAGIIGTVLAVAGLVVGFLAWRSPVAPPTHSASTATSASVSLPPETSRGGESGSSAAGRFLTDLPPDTGGGYVQRTGAHSLLMKCGTGESDDRQRDVSYLVPQVSYRSFTTTAAASGERETRVQVLLLIDGRVVADHVLLTGGRTPLAWSGEGASRLTLELICDPGARAVTFIDPVLTK